MAELGPVGRFEGDLPRQNHHQCREAGERQYTVVIQVSPRVIRIVVVGTIRHKKDHKRTEKIIAQDIVYLTNPCSIE